MTTLNETQAQYLANYLPSGTAWEAKNVIDSNLRKLLNGLGYEFQNIENLVSYLKKELSILSTVDFIDLHETAYGIPDNESVFISEGKKIDERRLNLLIKEMMEGADRVEDWEEIASYFGFKCKVYPARKVARFPFKFPFTFVDNPQYTIIVDFYNVVRPSEFPLQFPVIFGDGGTSIIKKVFEIIKPADCVIMYNYIES